MGLLWTGKFVTGLILALLLQAAPAEEWPRPIPHMTSTPAAVEEETGEKNGCTYLYIWQRGEEYQRVAVCVTVPKYCDSAFPGSCERGLTFTLEESEAEDAD